MGIGSLLTKRPILQGCKLHSNSATNQQLADKSGAIIMQVPMVDRLPQEFYDVVKDGDIITVNADEGYVEIAD